MKHINEIWKDIKDYEGLYQISNTGSIKSIERFRNGREGRRHIVKLKILKYEISNNGYLRIPLTKMSITSKKLVHRLVAEAFIINHENKRTVNHKNGNKWDNRVENLEWSTYSENHLHAFRELGKKPNLTGLGRFGALNPTSKKVYCINTGVVYGSLAEAGRELNINRSLISGVCRGNYKQAKGLQFKYA